MRTSTWLLLCAVAVLFIPLQSQAQTFTPIRINVAGGAYTDSQGRAWSADHSFAGGTAASVSRSISNTSDDTLYRNERWGPFSYRFTVPAGNYEVTLKFAETYFSSRGRRLFNVVINGKTVLADFDIAAEAGGPNAAVDRTFTIAAGDGTGNLLLEFVHLPRQPDDPKVDAIEIQRADSDAPVNASLRANPDNLDFGSINIGDNAVLTSALTNVGGSPIAISGVSVSGAGFDVSGTSAGQILLPGESAALHVTFAPMGASQVGGAIVVTSDAVKPDTLVSLSGAGLRLVSHAVNLQWTASTSPAVGYNVYSSGVSGGPYTKQTATPVNETSYQDASVQAGKTYYYVVTSVDASSLESVYSEQVAATIP